MEFSNESNSSRRITATLIDYMAIMAFSAWYIMTVGKRDEEGVWVVNGLPALVPILFWFAWMIVIESVAGRTLGHEITGLKVVSMDGNKINFSQALRRRICDAVEITWCLGLIAFILVKSTKYNQRLGDIWAKCLVVDKNKQFKVTDFEFEKFEMESQS